MSEEHGQGENLIVVFRAQDEYTANIIHGILTSEGIPSCIESKMVPWLDGVMTAAEGYWGNVVVPREYVKRSLELIDSYRSNNDM